MAVAEDYNPLSDDVTGRELEAQKVREQDTQMLGKLLDVGRDIDTPKWTLTKDGIGFAPLGNLMAISAPMKSGKTWLMVQLAVAMLRGEYMGLTCPLEHPSVLYVDTEQDEYDTMLIARRVHYLMGWDFRVPNERFRIAPLRSDSAEERVAFVTWAIEKLKPTAVFIDGIRDLLSDFNDLAESAELIERFMKATTEHRCAVWNVLHTNPGTNKMRGHLGTELGNKVTDVFSVEKKKDMGSVWFEVTHAAARHRDVEPWEFGIDDSGRFAVPTLISGDEGATEDMSSAKTKALDATMKEALKDGPLRYGELTEKVMKIRALKRARACEIISDAISSKVIGNDEVSGKYRYMGKTEVEKEKTENCPF